MGGCLTYLKQSDRHKDKVRDKVSQYVVLVDVGVEFHVGSECGQVLPRQADEEEPGEEDGPLNADDAEGLEFVELVGDEECPPDADFGVVLADLVDHVPPEVGVEVLWPPDLGLLPVDEEDLEVSLAVDREDGAEEADGEHHVEDDLT